MTQKPDLFNDKEPAHLPALPSAATPDEKWEMDWIEGPEVIIREYGSIAVYTNTARSVVIRQEGRGDDDDNCVFLSSVEAVRVLIAALKREIGDV